MTACLRPNRNDPAENDKPMGVRKNVRRGINSSNGWKSCMSFYNSSVD